MKSLKVLALAVVAGIGASFATQAATLTLTPVVAAYFDTSNNPAPIPANNALPGTYEVHVLLSISGLNKPEEVGFGNTAFNVGLSNSKLNIAGGWTGSNPTVDSNGAGFGGNQPLFLVNSDAGADANDLQQITVSVAGGVLNPSVDPRAWVGQAGRPATVLTTTGEPPYDIGFAYIGYTGGGTAALNVAASQLGTKLSTGSTEVRSAQFTLGSVNFGGEIPEPATLSLAALGGLAVIRRRRA